MLDQPTIGRAFFFGSFFFVSLFFVFYFYSLAFLVPLEIEFKITAAPGFWEPDGLLSCLGGNNIRVSETGRSKGRKKRGGRGGEAFGVHMGVSAVGNGLSC